MKKLAIVLGFVLLVFHHDFWNWDNANLVFGFMPVGLAYHVGFSLTAAAFWAFVIKFAWPHELETWANEGSPEPTPETTHLKIDSSRYKIT